MRGSRNPEKYPGEKVKLPGVFCRNTYHLCFGILATSLSHTARMPGSMNKIKTIAQKEPMDRVFTIACTVASSNIPPTTPVTVTKIKPEVMIV